MLTNIKFYESVPIGGNNFSEFFKTVQQTSDAVLSMAFGLDYTINVTGGSLPNRPVEYRSLTSSDGAVYFCLSAKNAIYKSNGSLNEAESSSVIFAKVGTRYASEYIPYIRALGYDQNMTDRYLGFEDLPVYYWEVLATAFDIPSMINKKQLTYKNNIPLSPYRVSKEYNISKSEHSFLVEKGVMDVRYNGVPQTEVNSNDLRFYTANPASLSRYQSKSAYIFGNSNQLTLTQVQLGAEYPEPTVSGKYKYGTVEGCKLDEWKNNFGTKEGYLEIRFPYTNFAAGESAILIKRTEDPYFDSNGGVIGTYNDPKYVYLPEDSSSGPEIASGCYKIIDKNRSIIRVNVTNNTLEGLRTTSSETLDNIRFTVISPEKLLEAIGENGITRYYSRYGRVFTGEYTKTELVNLFYDQGTTSIQVNRLTEGVNTEPSTDLIFSDKSSAIQGGIYAIAYPANALIDIESQKNKYYPDVVSMYYVPVVPFFPVPVADLGLDLPALKEKYKEFDAVVDVSEIEAYLEKNLTSWYNQDVIEREYKPVPRKEEYRVSLKKKGRLVGGIDPLKFDPTVLILRGNAGPSLNYYVHVRKTDWPENVGKIDEYVRRDAALPEPHYIDPPITKTFLEYEDTLEIKAGHQMFSGIQYSLEKDSELYCNGQFLLLGGDK